MGTVSEKATWPPVCGYTYSTWVKLIVDDKNNFVPISHAPITLFSLESENKKAYTHITIQQGGHIIVQTDTYKECLPLSTIPLTANKWHHIAIVQRKGKSKGALGVVRGISKVKLYIDGYKVQSAPINLMTVCPGGTKLVTKIGGRNKSTNSPVELEWHMGPTLLLEASLKAQVIYFIFLRGVGFKGAHEGFVPVSDYVLYMHSISVYILYSYFF